MVPWLPVNANKIAHFLPSDNGKRVLPAESNTMLGRLAGLDISHKPVCGAQCAFDLARSQDLHPFLPKAGLRREYSTGLAIDQMPDACAYVRSGRSTDLPGGNSSSMRASLTIHLLGGTLFPTLMGNGL